MSWIPKASKHLAEPRHLTAIVQLFEAIRLGKAGLRFVIHAPPQHGKTQTIIHGLLWLMMCNQREEHAYATYSADRSKDVSDLCKTVALNAGIPYDGVKRLWGDGSSNIRWTSVGGAFTGNPVTGGGLLCIDDPVKDRTEAESPTVQRKQQEWLHDVADARCHPGASIFINMTRWSSNDLAGYAIRELGFEYICLSALDDDDNPLWPDERPFDFLDAKRKANAYTWASIYQGRPVPRGSQVFEGPTTYTELPTSGRRIGFGLDCAYTAKSKADWSVMVKGCKVGDTLYVTDMFRRQTSIEKYKGIIKAATRPGSEIMWYVGGQEGGIADLLRPSLPGRKLIVKKATTDKLQRALGASEAWNLGLIQVPEEAAWLDDFISEVCSFTGVKDLHDDIVDALAALWDLLEAGSASYDKAFQKQAARMPQARGC